MVVSVSSITWAVPCETCLQAGICGQRRSWSDCAKAQSDQGFRCPRPESMDTIECISGEQGPDETLRTRSIKWIRTFCACSQALFRFCFWPICEIHRNKPNISYNVSISMQLIPAGWISLQVNDFNCSSLDRFLIVLWFGMGIWKFAIFNASQLIYCAN